MKIRPVRSYGQPVYPERFQAIQNPDLLSRHIPAAWLRSEMVAGAHNASAMLIEALRALDDLEEEYGYGGYTGLAAIASSYVRAGVPFDGQAKKLLKKILDKSVKDIIRRRHENQGD
ncbi:MAG: hypothetical protein HY897_05750 [Deltaproteobacteria bacterium]|nr:hypothetical protein [Deltaproteobacteria bacterium]